MIQNVHPNTVEYHERQKPSVFICWREFGLIKIRSKAGGLHSHKAQFL